MAEAKGHRDVARAELEANQHDTPKARAKVIEEKADAAYKVAKESAMTSLATPGCVCRRRQGATREGQGDGHRTAQGR